MDSNPTHCSLGLDQIEREHSLLQDANSIYICIVFHYGFQPYPLFYRPGPDNSLELSLPEHEAEA